MPKKFRIAKKPQLVATMACVDEMIIFFQKMRKLRSVLREKRTFGSCLSETSFVRNWIRNRLSIGSFVCQLRVGGDNGIIPGQYSFSLKFSEIESIFFCNELTRMFFSSKLLYIQEWYSIGFINELEMFYWKIVN